MIIYPTPRPAMYILTHSPTARFYIGSTVNLYRRLNEHRRLLQKGCHENKFLQEIFTTWEDFKVEFVYCQTGKAAKEEEQKALNLQYEDELCCNVSNLANPNWASNNAHFPTRHYKTRDELSEETRKKMSLARIGKPPPNPPRGVICDGIVFASGVEAARHFGINQSTVSKRISGKNKGYPEWRYTSP